MDLEDHILDTERNFFVRFSKILIQNNVSVMNRKSMAGSVIQTTGTVKFEGGLRIA